MSLSDVLALVFGASTLLTTLAWAFMWVGGQRQKQSSQDARIKALEDKLAGHDSTLILVTELRSEVKHLADELKRQPQVIALCVGEAIKAALAYRAPASRAAVGA